MRHSYKDIRLLAGGPVSTLVVDRPEVHNAIRHETMMEIACALDAVETDPRVRVLVITGSGEKSFISGGDISIMARGQSGPDTIGPMTKGKDVITRIEHFPKPVIARINGYALGGGLEVAMGCDLRIASENAVFGFPEIKLGIIPGYGGTQRLPRLIGMGRAKEMILGGEPISARAALEAGIVNRVTLPEALDAAVEEAAAILAARPPVAVHMAKSAMNNGIQADLRTGLEIESTCYSLCFGTEDRREGMSAFLEKRAPVFKGR